MAQIEIKWDFRVLKLSNLMIFTLLRHRVELKIECKIGDNLNYKKCFASIPYSPK